MANNLVIFLEEFFSKSLWGGAARTPAISDIPRVCVTQIKYQMFKYQILTEAKLDILVPLMNKCREVI